MQQPIQIERNMHISHERTKISHKFINWKLLISCWSNSHISPQHYKTFTSKGSFRNFSISSPEGLQENSVDILFCRAWWPGPLIYLVIWTNLWFLTFWIHIDQIVYQSFPSRPTGPSLICWASFSAILGRPSVIRFSEFCHQNLVGFV